MNRVPRVSGNLRPWARHGLGGRLWGSASLGCGVAIVGGLVVLAIVGCGPPASTAPVARLAGSVTIDGTPVAKGQIVFTPRSGEQAPPTTAEIVDGRYQADAVPLGSVSVVFSAVRATGKQSTEYSTPYPEYENLIPEKYRSGITLEVSGENLQQDFALLSK